MHFTPRTLHAHCYMLKPSGSGVSVSVLLSGFAQEAAVAGAVNSLLHPSTAIALKLCTDHPAACRRFLQLFRFLVVYRFFCCFLQLSENLQGFSSTLPLGCSRPGSSPHTDATCTTPHTGSSRNTAPQRPCAAVGSPHEHCGHDHSGARSLAPKRPHSHSSTQGGGQ